MVYESTTNFPDIVVLANAMVSVMCVAVWFD